MPQIVWSRGAQGDVQRLFRFLASKDSIAARNAVSAIRLAVKVLSNYPRMGRPVEGMPNEFRDWIVDFGDSGYVVRYEVQEVSGNEIVTILALRHQKEAGFF